MKLFLESRPYPSPGWPGGDCPLGTGLKCSWNCPDVWLYFTNNSPEALQREAVQANCAATGAFLVASSCEPWSFIPWHENELETESFVFLVLEQQASRYRGVFSWKEGMWRISTGQSQGMGFLDGLPCPLPGSYHRQTYVHKALSVLLQVAWWGYHNQEIGSVIELAIWVSIILIETIIFPQSANNFVETYFLHKNYSINFFHLKKNETVLKKKRQSKDHLLLEDEM